MPLDPHGTGPLPSEDEADRFFTDVPESRSAAPDVDVPGPVSRSRVRAALRGLLGPPNPGAPPASRPTRKVSAGTPSPAPTRRAWLRRRTPAYGSAPAAAPGMAPAPAGSPSRARGLTVAGRRPVPGGRSRPAPSTAPTPPGSSGTSTTARGFGGAVGALAAGLVLAGLAVGIGRLTGEGADASPVPATPFTAPAGPTLQQLGVDDCFLGTPAMTTSPVQPVPCSATHDGRVVGKTRLLDEDVTVGKGLPDGAGRRACAAAFGTDLRTDDDTWWVAIPSLDDYFAGSRLVVCGSRD